ncbi:MAG: transposase [Sphaerochaetaceae bacterium]|nr:transposase [Sphaerochaetaceae bacterium]
MAFIKVQKLVRNEEGNIISGSASIMTTEYDRSYKGRSRHTTREKLGKVLSLDATGKRGVFLSPTRGLVAYDATSDTFENIEKGDSRIRDLDLFAEPEIHTVFGDAYLFLKVCQKSALIQVLRTAFTQDRDYERVLSHLLHSVLKDGSKISCDDYIGKSFASYLFDSIPIGSLGSDTAYFSMMGEDSSRLAFFKAFVADMRKKNPGFGIGCYVDSTPLPNTIRDNPFNALCSHGIQNTSIQTRLVLVLDEKTGFPVWYSIIPGNVLDLSTLESTLEDVAESLDIRIDNFVLDAGYASKELIQGFHSENEWGKTMTVRMPAKRGYPHKTLYHKCKKLMGNAKYEFIRQGHTYFGKHIEIEVFGFNMHAYVYVDKDNALEGSRNYRLRHEEEYEGMTDKEKNWTSVRFGFFILLSTEKKAPDEKLDDYFGRTQIESVFKTSKEYLNLLPLSKWSDLTVRGKILSDIISTIALLQLRKMLSGPGISTCKLIGKTQSLMCTKKRDGTVIVEVPNKQVKNFYHKLKVKIPSSVDLQVFKTETLKLKIKGT